MSILANGDNAYNVSATGATVNANASSFSVTIPNDSQGRRARLVRLQVTGVLYVKFGVAGVTATNQDMLLSPNFDVLINCMQHTTIACIQEGSPAKLNITPLET